VRPLKASANSESKRMFESDFFEFFSRIPPWQPPAIYLPTIAVMLYLAFAAGASSFGVLGGFIVGLTAWTLLEYWAHRVLFHWDAKSELGKKFVWILHGVHHDWPNDKLRLVFPPGLSVPLAIGFFFLFSFLFGDVHRYATFAGLVTGYLAYDMIHYATHHFTSDNPVFKYLRKYHMAHHFKHEPTRYGVSNPLWDYVFGTAPKKS
jgi:sterol desaturase/sphingolipid hydroxylase (fatty acid hydroxylase superfamily)